MASRSLSGNERTAALTAIGGITLISPPAGVGALVGLAAHEAYAWWSNDKDAPEPPAGSDDASGS